MSQVRETAVKLFGWTMTSPLDHDSLSSSSPARPDSFDYGKEDSSSSFSSSSPSLQPHKMNNQACDNSEQDNPSLKITPDLNNDSDNSDDQHSEITTATTSEEKSTDDLKKPDKILPCPRCKSVDTKFCYYNNYNVNQPRHFCRNCQRYWTAGGTMRTVPVGSGRRKNKGWVSSDITSEDTNNGYCNSSTKFLSFESSGSFVTKSGKRQSNDAKAESISQELNDFQGFLPPQVTSSVSPHQYPPNPSFYHMPVFWGYAAPVWSTLETSTCLGKRTRDETSYKCVRESKDAVQSTSITTKSHVWCPAPMKHQKTEQFRFFHHGSEAKSRNERFVPETYLTLQSNPAAMARSINFRESM